MAKKSPARAEPSRADIDLAHAVTRELVASEALDPSAIRVTAIAGRVELTGRVASHAQRLAAATLAEKVAGVEFVDNRLTIDELDLAAHSTDIDLTEAVTHAIVDSTVRIADLRVDVRQRVATLHGRVGSERDRAALRHAVQQVPGVHVVDSRLDLEPSAGADADVEELDPAACFELLSTAGVGRLGVQEADGVDIFPVNYLVHGDKVYFRSGPGVKMIRLTRSPDVAFEVDGHDEAQSWSVVVKGIAERLDDDDEILTSGIFVAPTAHPSEKLNYVRIQPRQITGRRFRHAP